MRSRIRNGGACVNLFTWHMIREVYKHSPSKSLIKMIPISVQLFVAFKGAYQFSASRTPMDYPVGLSTVYGVVHSM